METLQTSVNKDWRGANINVKALRTEWYIWTADLWLDETIFPRVRKSAFRDCTVAICKVLSENFIKARFIRCISAVSNSIQLSPTECDCRFIHRTCVERNSELVVSGMSVSWKSLFNMRIQYGGPGYWGTKDLNFAKKYPPVEWEGESWQCGSLFCNMFRLHWDKNGEKWIKMDSELGRADPSSMQDACHIWSQ